MTTPPLPRHSCPVCRQVLDAAAPVAGNPEPSPGDLSVCAYCTTILEFDAELRPQQVSAATLAGLDMHTMRQLEMLRRAVRQLRAGTPT